MVRILDVQDMARLIGAHGLETIIMDIMNRMRLDFKNWENFQKIPRPAFHVPDGVLELMPICNDSHFAFKTVNGHPKNPLVGKQTVVATGQVNRVQDGYPILMCEMTLITAIRTAAVSALASDIMSRGDSKSLAVIGTGAQSEYQTIAHKAIRDITQVRYFDTDSKAMAKYADNMRSNFAGAKVDLIACEDAETAVQGADIIIVCTACKAHGEVIHDTWLSDGQHINGLGGDCPGKTELQLDTIRRARVMVEFFEQSFIEGEIQRLDETEARLVVDLHLHEAIRGTKIARENDTQITVFDGVGMALEDFSALMVTQQLAEQYDIGIVRDMVPNISDPKDLFGVLRG